MQVKGTADKSSGWKMTGKEYRLGNLVTINIYENETFEVVGIREKELELKGDWSGGTHNVSQSGWYPVDQCKLILPEYDWVKIKE